MVSEANTVCKSMPDYLDSGLAFCDEIAPHDVEYGFGVICWAREIRSLSLRLVQPAGWVLPGGARTTRWEKAHWAAMAIHDAFIAVKTAQRRVAA